MKLRIVYLTAVMFFYAFLLRPDASLAKELCLVYDIESKQVTEAKEGKNEEKEVKVQVTIGLGSSYLYIAGKDGKVIFDFSKKRIIKISKADKSYSDISLFSDIGFRYIEFQNRLYLRDIWTKALEKSEVTPLEEIEGIFDLESLFGIVKPDAKEQLIAENKLGDVYEYSFDNQVVVECKLSADPLSDRQAALFEKYLIYRCSLHPQIRKKIISRKQVPLYLKYTYKTIGKTAAVEMSLVKVTTEEYDSYTVPADYTRVYEFADKELSSIVSDVMSGKNRIKRLEKPDFEKIADDLKAKGSYFDAVLVILEYSLQAGDDSAAKMSEIISSGAAADARFRTFIEVPRAKDKESAQKSLEVYQSISRDGLTRGYIIDIMIADDQMALGDYNKAQESFLKALKENPYITGVYKDLGDLYNSSYETAAAWQCWDAARFLYPGHKMLRQIDEYEKWLADNFPDFFLPD